MAVVSHPAPAMPTKLLAVPALLLATSCLAAPPDACGILKIEEINQVAASKVEQTQRQKTGNPSQCGFLDARRSAVVVVTLREVQYAVKDEMQMERDNLQKIYKARSKDVESVGDAGFWMAANHQLTFRKGKVIVSVAFATPRNQNELDTAILARVIDSRLKK